MASHTHTHTHTHTHPPSIIKHTHTRNENPIHFQKKKLKRRNACINSHNIIKFFFIKKNSAYNNNYLIVEINQQLAPATIITFFNISKFSKKKKQLEASII